MYVEGKHKLSIELTVKVPGKVMLCGEYHVLTRGARALAFTLDAYLEVYVRYGTRVRQSLLLHANLWDAPRQINAETVSDDMLVATVGELLPSGQHRVEELRVTSQLHPSFGFGSSSALRLALACIAYLQAQGGSLLIPPAQCWQLAGQAFALQKKSQQFASGYDVATQCLGGIVEYCSAGGDWPDMSNVQSLQAVAKEDLRGNLASSVHLFIGGKGADTTSVMRSTKNWLAAQGHLPMITASEALRHAFIDTLRDLRNLHTLVAAMAQWRVWFAASPYFPAHIDAALRTVRGRDRQWSWKTSGAGGEDALIVVGHKQDIGAVTACLVELGWQRYDYHVVEGGLQLQRLH